MLHRYCEHIIRPLLEEADIRIDGTRPWDIRVIDPRFYCHVLFGGNLGLGESWINGWWSCQALDEFFFRLLQQGVQKRIRPPAELLERLRATLWNLQRPTRAGEVGRRHYDLGNDLFRAMLDTTMLYSCGYWKDALTLDEAQEAKLRLIFEKLQVEPGMEVLDIGCGWGGAARFGAERYGLKVTALTISTEQWRTARELCRGLPVEVELLDYRELTGTYDRIYSIGMFEHVGYRNYRTYFETIRHALKPDGITLLHTIGGNLPAHGSDPWTDRYIFPNSMVPSASQITTAYEGLFMLEDWHVFGYDYALTLMAWHRNLEHAWNRLERRYGTTFRRIWTYYLLSCAGAFRAHHLHLWQLLLTPHGIPGRTTIPR